MRDIQLDFTVTLMNMIRSMHLWMLILMILRKIGGWQKNSLDLFHALSVFRRRIEFYFKKILGRNYDTVDTAGVG